MPRFLAVFALFLFCAAPSARAASDTWTNNAAASWATGINWLSGTAPGATSGTTSTDVAAFGYALTAPRTVTVDANRNIGGIIFSNTSANAYTLNGGSLLLSSGGLIEMRAGVGAHNDAINTPIAIQGDGGTATFANNASLGTSVLVINTTVTGVANTGNTTTLTLNGTNGSANKLAGIISDGANGGKLAVVKNEAGSWRFSAANTFSGGVTLNAGVMYLENSGGLGNNTNPVTINGGALTAYLGGSYTLAQPTTIGGDFIFGAPTTGILTLSGNMDLGGITRLITVNTTNCAISGNISNGGISKWGTGILTLSGANNTYANDTSINAGTLQLGAANVIPDGSGKGIVNIGSTALLDLNGFSDTVNGLNSTGTVTNSAAGTSTLTVGNNNQTSTFSGAIKAGNGAVTLAKTGTGTLTLSGTNSFTGGMQIQGGQVTVSGTNNTFSGGISINSGAILQITGNVGNNAITNNGAVILTPVNNLAIFGNSISGSGSVTNSTGNNATFTNVNSYTGGFTFLNSGNITLNSPGISMPGNITYAAQGGGCEVILGAAEQVADAAVLTFLTNAGGRFELQGFNETIGGIQDVGGANARVIQSAQNFSNNLPATLTLNVTGANAYNFGGNGSANSFVRDASGGVNSALTIIKNGTGTQTFSGPSGNVNYTGPTTINGGVLEFSGTNSVANSSAITLNGGTVKFSGGGARSATITGSGNLISAGTTGVALTLSGNNSYAGNTTNSAGMLTLGHTNALGTSSLVIANGAVLATSADLSGGNGVANAILLASAGTVSNANNLKLSGVISGPGAFSKLGNGILTLPGNNDYTGATTIGGGIVSIATLGNGGNNSPIGASSSAAANLVFGGGTLSYTGPTASSDRSFTMGAWTNTIDVSTGGTTLTLTGSSPANTNFLQTTGAGSVTLDPGAGGYSVGSISANGGVLTLKSGSFTATKFDPYLGVVGYNVGAGARGGKLVLDGATLNVTNGSHFKVGANAAGNLDILSGTVNAGDFVIGHNGNAIGTQSGGTVSAANLYHQNTGTGTNTITGGTLTVRRIYNFSTALGNFTLILNGGILKAAAATVNLIDNDPININNNQVVVQLGSNGAAIDTSLSSATVARPLDDLPGQVGQLVKLGSNILTLASNNTYTGSTTVSNGTLLVNGSISTGAVAVKSGATLGGIGIINGPVSVESNGNLAAGASGVGLLTLNQSLTNAGGSTLTFDITNSANADLITVAGSLYPSGVTTIRLTNPAALTNGNYTLIQVAGTLNGSATNFAVSSPNTLKSYGIAYQSGNVVLTVGDRSVNTNLTWTGSAGASSNLWDVSTTANWTISGSRDFFIDNDAVTFDSAGLSNPVVNLVTVVSPASVTVNSSGNYTFTGSGAIAGTNHLTKSGAGMLTIGTTNSYTGITTISAGTLSISNIANGGNVSAIGASSSAATNLVFAGGSLSYSGGTASSDRSFTMNGWTNAIDVSSAAATLTLSGSAPANTNFLEKTGAGTLVLDPGAGSYTVGALSAEGGVLTLKSGSFTATKTDPFSSNIGYSVGAGARGGTLVVDGATLNVTNGNYLKVGAFTAGNLEILSGTVNASDLVVGHNANAVGTQSGGSVTVTNLYHQNTGAGTNTITGGTLTVRRIYNWSSALGNFTLVLNGGIVRAATGSVNLIDNDAANTNNNQIVVQLGTNGATIDTSLSSAAIVRPLTDLPGHAGQLVKIGANTLTLAVNNTFTGPTIVSNGTLLVNGSISNSAVTVKSGATLGGSGSIGGSVTLNSGAFAQFTEGSPLTIAVSLTLNTNVVHLSLSNNVPAGSYTLANYNTGGSSGAFATSPVIDSGSLAAATHGATIVTSGGSVVLVVATNHLPVANDNTYTRGAVNDWHIFVSQLLTNATDVDGDTLTLVSVGVSTNGITLYHDGTLVGYTNTNLVADQFTYTVTDGFGGTNSGVITLTASNNVTGTSSITGVITGNPTTLTAYGIPGETYITQRAMNLDQIVWDDIATNVLTGTNVVISVTDSNPPSGSAFYRLKWQQP